MFPSCFLYYPNQHSENHLKKGQFSVQKSSLELLDSACGETNNTESTEALVEKLQQEVTELKMKFCALTVEKFGLQCFAGSDDDIQFYTGFLFTLLLLYQLCCNALEKISETDLICIQVLNLALLYLELIFCISS